MRTAWPALLVLLAVQAKAQDPAGMGRLFTTPAERAQLDAQRSQAPTPAAGTHSEAVPPAAPPAAAAPSALDSTTGTQATSGPATVTQGESGAETQGLRLDGVIRRSHGPTLLIVNGEVQPAPAGGVMRGAVRLQADGRSVVLKPGQSYDPATGEVHESAR